MQIMTKINDFEEIFFKSSIIFHVFAPIQKESYRNDEIPFIFYMEEVNIKFLLRLVLTPYKNSDIHLF